MRAFTRHQGIAAPLLRDNIDTDSIIPSREMRTVSRSGLADGLFAPWRYTDPDTRTLNPDFVLNQSAYADASILLAGDNFGCGSSREHAVWALMEWGFRVVIAPSFASIFRNNALRNGLLSVELPAKDIAALNNWCGVAPSEHRLTIDLETCTIGAAPDATPMTFAIDPTARSMLLEGLDEIGLTEQQSDLIAAFEAADRQRRPWAYLSE